jgi:poly(3-hydroxybutyrate) depolymerase
MDRRPASRLALAVAGLLAVAACGGGASHVAPSLAPVVPMSPSQAAPQSAERSIAAAPTGIVALGRYNIDRDRVFVAGISSGGFFGVQMHVAHSATFKGAAIYAGGVYYCGLDNVGIALTACGGLGLYQNQLVASETYLDAQSALGTIDNSSHLHGQPVYLWSGTHDTVVDPRSMNDLNAEYAHYGARLVKYDNTFPAGHGWESPTGELACGDQKTPYMVKCDAGATPYDSEATWLRGFLGELRHRNNGTLRGSLINFDQTAFGAAASNSMDTNGYVFVPKGCERHEDGCSLVVAFHGCLQTQADIGTKFVTESGINEWADTNRVVVLYPYAIKSATVPFNPQGCWDWWGYDDPNYALKSGTQVSIVYKMVQRLMGGGEGE